VACDGELFAAMTKKDMQEVAGGPVGIHIFNSREKKIAELKSNSSTAAGAGAVVRKQRFSPFIYDLLSAFVHSFFLKCL